MRKIVFILALLGLLICSACGRSAGWTGRVAVLASLITDTCSNKNDISSCNKYSTCIYYKIKSDRSIKDDDMDLFATNRKNHQNENNKNSRVQQWINYCAGQYNIKK